MAIAVNKVLDVADGTRPGQFEVGDRRKVQSLSDLDPVYRQLLDGPVTAVVSVIGSTGLSNLSPCGSTTTATWSSSTWLRTARR